MRYTINPQTAISTRYASAWKISPKTPPTAAKPPPRDDPEPKLSPDDDDDPASLLEPRDRDDLADPRPEPPVSPLPSPPPSPFDPNGVRGFQKRDSGRSAEPSK